MKTYKAKYDGKQILFDQEVNITPNSKCLVLVIEDEEDILSAQNWSAFSLGNLNRAYSRDEPEYALSMVKEPNPKYEGR